MKFLITTFFVLVLKSVLAQDTTFYYSYLGKVFLNETPSIYEIKSINGDSLKRYFLANNQLAIQGKYKEGRLNGETIKYHQNGEVYEKSTYENGNQIGNIERWYPSGQIMGQYMQMGYEEINRMKYDHQERIYSLYDSLGNQIVREGDGLAYELNDDLEFLGSGEVRNGLKHGIWRNDGGSEVKYEENYYSGRLENGKSWDSLGTEFDYEILVEYPHFRGGLNAYYDFLRKKMKYPEEAQRKGIEGRVFVQFTVTRFGDLREMFVVQGIGSGCDNEALRVLSLSSKKWLPGKKRGQLVDHKVIQNLLFRL